MSLNQDLCEKISFFMSLFSPIWLRFYQGLPVGKECAVTLEQFCSQMSRFKQSSVISHFEHIFSPLNLFTLKLTH